MSDVERPKTIILVHMGTKERREASVLGVNKAWKMALGLGPMLGTYCLDIKLNRLKFTETTKKLLLWQAEDIAEVERIWKELIK
jgi:predicted metallopeptidase